MAGKVDDLGIPKPGVRERLEAIFLPAGELTLEQRFHQGLCLLGFLLAFVVFVPLNTLQHFSPWVNYTMAAFGVGAGALYLASRRGHRLMMTSWLLLVITQDLLWYLNGGSLGSVCLYFSLTAIFLVIFFQGRLRLLMLGVFLINCSALFLLEQRFPHLVIPFEVPEDRFLDMLLGFLLSNLIAILMLWVVVSGYWRERLRLKESAEALAIAEKRQASLLRNSWDILSILDADGNMLYHSPGLKRILGFEEEDLRGQNALAFVHPDDLPHAKSAFQEMLATPGVPVPVRFRLARKDGLWVAMETVGVNYLDDPLVRGLVLNTREMTERLKAEQDLMESRSLILALIDGADDLVLSVDAERFSLMLCNKAAQRFFQDAYGITPRDGMLFKDLLPVELVALWNSYFERALEEGSLAVDYLDAPSGRDFTYSLKRLERGGKVFGISIFGKDITRLKRAEEERQRIELQLWQSQKMESLGSLAGGVAHDFNNMLGGIIGYADLLLVNEEDPRNQGYLKAILGAAERSSDMTQKLLAFGRRGKNVVEPVDLDTLVRDGHVMLKPSLKQGVDVVLELGKVPSIDADPSQINQVFLNLVINANEAIVDRGLITIRTRTESVQGRTAELLGIPAGEYVAFSVTDTGIGMREDVRRRLFEPFFTTKTDGKVLGSGLGLSTVYGIVHSHHGAIHVDSHPGHGSTFTVRFPKGKLNLAEHASNAPIQRGRGTILIVEDEPVMMKFTKAALRELGYNSLSAWDGEEGSRMFREHHDEISAVMLDLKMPKMGGRECFGELQKMDPEVIVLICTGYGENEEVQDLISRGARGLLKKPFRVADLADHLKRMIPQG